MLTFTKEDVDKFVPNDEDKSFEVTIMRHDIIKTTDVYDKQYKVALIMSMVMEPSAIIQMLIVVNLSVGLEIGYVLGQKEALRLMEEGK